MQSITLQTNDTIVVSGDILGRLQFAASAESDGGAARLISAGIYGMGEGSFSSSSNPASLVFITSDNDANAASAKLKISHEGHFLPISGSYNIGESSNRFNSIYGTGLAGYSLELTSNVPSDTTNKLYNDGGTLKFNGSAVGGAGGGGGIDNVVEDTTPQLGGNLDLNSYSVTGVGNINIDGTIEANYIYSDLDGPIVVECKNSTGSTIAAGTPVYVSGYYGTNGKALIAPADASDSSKMPAIGLLETALDHDTEGYVHCFGLSIGMSTASFSVGDTVYVASGEGITNTRPTASNVLVQNIGRVLRSDASQGRILVLGPGRTNDVPNSGNFEILSVTNSVTAGSLVKSGGTSSQFLKADGSTDSSTYLTSHPTISAASSVDNSNGNVIQDITLDSNGHVTVLDSTDLDSRYYTETEIDAFNYLANVVEDTTPQLGGNLDLQTYDITSDGTTGGDIKLGYHAGFITGTTYTIITDNANQKVGINIDSPSYALDIGQGNNIYSTTSDMRVQQIVPLTSLLLGTAHALSVTTPQGGHYGSVLFGNGAAPTISKGISYATNYFSVAGDAQKVSTVVQYESTDASTYYLNAAKTGGYLYSTYVRNDTFLLPPDSSATFTIHLIANNDTDGTSAGWIFRGCVKSVNKSLSFVGSPITENFADGGMSSATAAIEVQDGSGISAFKRGGLVIKVNGLTGKTIRWVATIDAVLTSF